MAYTLAPMIGAHVGHLIGRQFGTYLGRQIALGACRDDRADDFDRRPFTPRIARLPGAVDLRPWMTPVEDQGQLGSCAANALVGGVEYLVRRETGRHVDLSRSFVYFCQRLWDGSVREDVGASMVDGVRVLARLGVPTEASWPYHPDLFAVQPPRLVLREAAALKLVDWWAVPVDADAFRGCLAAGFPIAFATRVTESFVRTSARGECGMPEGALDPRHGRHALLAVGYDDARRVFVVRNSWGAAWGDRGYVYMPYAYVLNREWTSGCWALRLTAREAFDPGEHGAVDLRAVPKAPPGGGGAAAAGSVGAMGAQVAVGALTGSGLLAGLAGGLVAGITPGVAKRLTRDRGAFAGEDLADAILAAMRAGGAPPHGLEHFPWDDGLDEEALVERVDAASAARPVRAAGRAGPAQ
ncbi:MAG: C1 family peptidase, partial [Sandaracinaceae bacterium]|nr:C1 family peptidase [Sandaracinaceae bacterium]